MLRIYVASYGMPGDVENKNITSPSTFTEWKEAAKTAESEHGGFTEVTNAVPPGSDAEGKKSLVNVGRVEWVEEIEAPTA